MSSENVPLDVEGIQESEGMTITYTTSMKHTELLFLPIRDQPPYL
jgi:hypothetical protein